MMTTVSQNSWKRWKAANTVSKPFPKKVPWNCGSGSPILNRVTVSTLLETTKGENPSWDADSNPRRLSEPSEYWHPTDSKYLIAKANYVLRL